ncbi:MAG TPA: cupin domain-containing protein [Candidatus Paceibacterota bacterium]|jgi:mannose-6-phosphate isomerase-like protein (cupin superfamily)
MKGFVTNIERETLENEHFRKVLYTSHYMQLVVMTVPAGGEIGKEVHGQDQFIRVEAGLGKAVLDGVEHELKDGSVVVIPASTEHNILNTGEEPLKLYTIYAMPHHADGTVHSTKEEADQDHEEFLGDTSE